MSYRVGVDIGGTFTDFCVFDETRGHLRTFKVLSTPATPGQEVLSGLEQLRDRYDMDLADITYFTHGQTVGLNTVIQRNGASLALLVTENFRDVLELQRLRMPDAFNLRATRPAPLIPRKRVLPVSERLDALGVVVTPLDADQVRQAARTAREMGVDGIVAAFLNSHRNVEHEREALRIAEEAEPSLFTFSSADVWPVVREYERTITAVINGYVHPRIEHYLTTLEDALRELRVRPRPLVAKSNGGVMSAARGKRDCVQILLSGTASGAIGAAHVASQCGVDKAISLDMGGTSADVALIVDGEPRHGTGEHVGDFTLYVPSVSVSSIGAGGGSLAWVDDHGLLHVGPESAGAEPGPACYGVGDRPTLTDAFAVCGLLGHSDLAYHALHLQPDRARAAIAPLAERMERSVEEAASAVIDTAVSEMHLELSKLMARYGADPREFVLLAFGGAGPMAACFLARDLGLRSVLIPARPGVLSALGGLVSDIKNDFIRTVYTDLLPGAAVTLQAVADEIEEEAMSWYRGEFAEGVEPSLRFSADMRYVGQSFEIEVPLAAEALAAGDLGSIAEAFHARHEATYGYSDASAPTQLINLRVVLVASSPKPEFPEWAAGTGTPVPISRPEVFLDGRTQRVALYHREDLGAGDALAGPAIIVQDDATTCILDGFALHVDRLGHLMLHSTPA